MDLSRGSTSERREYQDIQDHELYEFKDFQKMFEIGKMRVAYDKKTGEPKGIYAVQVKPTSILTSYLDGPNRSLGLLDIKVFQYSHFSQREHKRLIRYLNLQWKIRTLKRTLQQPFKVATLLKVMDMSSRYNGVQQRDKFETVLDELQKDKVIESWCYSEEINEEQVGKKGWFKNYWTKINVTILPTDIVVKENQKKLAIDSNYIVNEDLIKRMNQQNPVHTFNHFSTENSKITHNQEAATIESLNMSIRQTAEEIGIAHTTLSRYLRKENKRQNNKNDEKMMNWLKEKTLTYM